MRLPMIIGHAGLYATIGIIVVAHIISITTGLSVSSIATDKKVEAGGTYYMISRSLGLPIGGTLGLALFVGLSFSVSLYLIGFSESFLGTFGYEISKDNIRIAGTAILLLVTIITFISTSLALKTQYFIMAAIFLSLLSIFFGKHDFAPVHPAIAIPGGTVGLMVLFGIFFPAVTGFEAGVSMSGDLKDPKKSIPLGSISAIAVGLVVYIGLAFYFSYTVQADKLANDPQILMKISRVPQLVIAGIWGATLSSSLGSILAAPRILQATALDRITPRFFSRGKGKTNEPQNALLLTFVIAEAGILIGELNIIARIVSIFFITTYGFLNLSCAFEAMTSADFRPAFKTPVWVSLLGSVAAMIVMIQLDFLAMVGATIILGALYTYLKRKELVLQTGDAWSSIWASLVKTGLKRLKKNKLQNRNWRPNIIMFSGSAGDRPALIEMGKNISGRFGLITGFQLVQTKDPVLVKHTFNNEDADTDEYFINVHQCHDIYSGMDEVFRVYGYSGMEPNSILMGWSRNQANKKDFLQMIDRLVKNNFNSLFLSNNSDKQILNKKIDIWWSGWGSNLSFGLNLIRHITGTSYWKDAELRIFLVTDDSALIDSLYHSIRKILTSYRIEMEIKIINNAIEQLSRNSLIIRESARTELSIIGIPDNKFDKLEKMYQEVNELVDHLGKILFINASDNFETFDLLDNSLRIASQELNKKDEIEIPELKKSVYPEIAREIVELDKKGMANLNALFNTVFVTGFRECLYLVQEVSNAGESVANNLEKLIHSKEKFQKEKILSKLRNDFFFNARRMMVNYLDEKLVSRKEMFEKGLAEYLETLDETINALPKKLIIRHSRIEFQKAISDSNKLKRFKRRSLFLNPFSKNISIRAKFQKISKYYLFDNRLSHLKNLLSEFQNFDMAFLAQVRNYLTHIIEILETLEKEIEKPKGSVSDLTEIKQEITEPTQIMDKNIKELMNSMDHDLHFEYRNACQKLSDDLEKLRLKRLTKENRKSSKFYRSLHSEIIEFSEVWYDKLKNNTNRIYLDLLIKATRDRISREIDDIIFSVSKQVSAELLNPIKQLRKKVEGSANNSSDTSQIFEFQVGFKLDLLQDTESLITDVHKIIDTLPEEIQISDNSPVDILPGVSAEQESKILIIPVQRIVRHYVDSLLLSPLSTLLGSINDDLKKQEYLVKDHLSLMEFEQENLDKNDADYRERYNGIIKDTLNELENEEDGIQQILIKLGNEIEHMIEMAFEPASSHLIVESSQKITHIIREYQGKQTVSKFGALRQNIKKYIKSKTVRLLYSQSEGILFARKLSIDENIKSSYEEIAELLEEIVPDPDIQSKIPSYYQNLFSGKSSIGEDFWIERTEEQESFERALNRYKRFKKGGIIIYGERDCGKTALSKYLCRKHFRAEQVFHIFPPLQGSVDVEVFTSILKKSSGYSGSSSEISEFFRNDSVLVIHDLELWWERCDQGVDVIHTILKMIEDYSNQFLIIVNINSYAYKFLNALYSIEDKFLAHIRCRPFDSEDLKELIMRRHRSSGLNFSFGKRSNDQVSEIKLASIFNRIFRISEGNPGMALNIWLCMIKKIEDDDLFMQMPKIPDYSSFQQLDEDWMIILAQIVLHKRATIEKLACILGMVQSEIQPHISSMLMCGLIVERNSELYIINSYLNNAISEILTMNELI